MTDFHFCRINFCFVTIVIGVITCIVYLRRSQLRQKVHGVANCVSKNFIPNK